MNLPKKLWVVEQKMLEVITKKNKPIFIKNPDCLLVHFALLDMDISKFT